MHDLQFPLHKSALATGTAFHLTGKVGSFSLAVAGSSYSLCEFVKKAWLVDEL